MSTILFLIILLNVQFILMWILRFLSVTFRLYLVRLREFTIFRFLNFIDINDYEADLKIAVKEEIIQAFNNDPLNDKDSRIIGSSLDNSLE